MFTFNPKTEQEVLTANLLEKGEYPFVVKSCQAKTSKSGNPMLEVVLCVWDKQGKEHTIFDYLMESMEFKLRHFFVSIGMEESYMKGAIEPASTVGKQGHVKIFIREDKTGQYQPKNAVGDYLVAKGEAAPAGMGKVDEFNDDIMF